MDPVTLAAVGVAAGAGYLAVRAAKGSSSKHLTTPAPSVSASHIVDQGRVVRGLQPNRQTSDGRIVPHWGIDVSAPIGTPVRAAKSGRVIRAEPINGYGNAIVVKHDADGKSTLYGHLHRMNVRVGANVQGGQVIGEVGRTSAGPSGVVPSWGHTMGAHLHMEVHPGPTPNLGTQARRLDPIRWLQQNNIQPFGRQWER